VDLAVERDPEATLLEAHRLLPCSRGVDDREARVGEAEFTVQVDARAVGPTMVEDRRHPRDYGAICRPARAVPDAGDATHGV
jgi:hypothetical protein